MAFKCHSGGIGKIGPTEHVRPIFESNIDLARRKILLSIDISKEEELFLFSLRSFVILQQLVLNVGRNLLVFGERHRKCGAA